MRRLIGRLTVVGDADLNIAILDVSQPLRPGELPHQVLPSLAGQSPFAICCF
jgi:hypothetical protein